MKTIAWFAAVLLGASAAAGGQPLPEGSFAGSAQWRGAGGMAGRYSVERTFAGNTMKSRFAWNEGQPRVEEHALTFALGADPVFDVLDPQGQVVGQGYCHAGACAYRANLGELSVDESFRWTEQELHVLGSKSGPGFAVVWSETLARR